METARARELRKAKQVAHYALKTRSQSSRDVKHLGLKSMISNQILRKYSRNRVLKKVRSVKLTVPSQGIKVLRELRTLIIPCLGARSCALKFLSVDILISHPVKE